MTFDNYGMVSLGVYTTTYLSPQSVPGAGLTFDNFGKLDVAANATLQIGQSNGAFCFYQRDHLYVGLEPQSLVDLDGNIMMSCNRLIVAGGTIEGTGNFDIAGSQGPQAASVAFSPRLPAGPGGHTDILNVDGVSLSGTIPAGWTLDSTGPVAVAPGLVNRGKLALDGSTVSGPGTFTNYGSISTTGSDANFETRQFINAGTMAFSGPYTDFGNTVAAPGLPMSFQNGGTLVVAPQGVVNFGQSNGDACIGSNDTLSLTFFPGSRVANQGAINVFCNRVDIDGGHFAGTPILLNGARGDGSVVLAFGPDPGPVPPSAPPPRR